MVGAEAENFENFRSVHGRTNAVSEPLLIFSSSSVIINIKLYLDIKCTGYEIVISERSKNFKNLVSVCTLGSPLVDGIFLVQKMCIYSCVTLSTTLLIHAVQFNARSACDASCLHLVYIFS